MTDKRLYADDDHESMATLFQLRAPSLFLGLLLGVGISFLTSNFEEVLAKNVHIAFFLPFIVYIAAAVGTQTEAIYSRDLKSGRAKFGNYLKKELGLGLLFGICFAFASSLIAFLWLKDEALALTVGLSAFAAVASAPLIALLVTQGMQYFKEDPAAGSGPIATVIQDMVSILIYGLICTKILL